MYIQEPNRESICRFEELKSRYLLNFQAKRPRARSKSLLHREQEEEEGGEDPYQDRQDYRSLVLIYHNIVKPKVKRYFIFK